MRLSLFFLFGFCSMGVFATADEHADLLAHSHPSCARRLKAYGLMPTERHEEAYSPENVLATEMLIDGIHINRLFYGARRSRDFQSHLDYFVSLKSSASLELNAKRLIESYFENGCRDLGKDYVANAFGLALPAVLATDNAEAGKTREAMTSLERVLTRLAYSIKYVKAWRRTLMEMQKVSPNTRYQNWLSRFPENALSEALTQVSVETELSLRALHPLFRIKNLPKHPITLHHWEERFPSRNLPVIAQRALAYLNFQLQVLPILSNGALQALLDELSTHVAAFNKLVSLP